MIKTCSARNKIIHSCGGSNGLWWFQQCQNRGLDSHFPLQVPLNSVIFQIWSLFMVSLFSNLPGQNTSLSHMQCFPLAGNLETLRYSMVSAIKCATQTLIWDRTVKSKSYEVSWQKARQTPTGTQHGSSQTSERSVLAYCYKFISIMQDFSFNGLIFFIKKRPKKPP